MKYVREGTVIAVRLVKGEDIIASVQNVCKKEGITSGRLQGIGAVQRAVLGYFDTEKKEYVHFECKGELVSCIGNIAKKKDEIVVHAHAVIGDRTGECKGGHIVQAEASATVELFIDILLALERARDADTGLFLLDL